MESDCTDASSNVAIYRRPLQLIPAKREPGQNKCGMVVFRIKYFGPETPENGREMVLVANDITYSAGSFGPVEDAVFKAAVELSIAERLPIIYVAANSGARVGLAKEVMECFRVAWVDDDAPSKGFKFLYLEDEDYQML